MKPRILIDEDDATVQTIVPLVDATCVRHQDRIWYVRATWQDNGNYAVLSPYDPEDKAREHERRRAQMRIQVARMFEDLETSIMRELQAIDDASEITLV